MRLEVSRLNFFIVQVFWVDHSPVSLAKQGPFPDPVTDEPPPAVCLSPVQEHWGSGFLGTVGLPYGCKSAVYV